MSTTKTLNELNAPETGVLIRDFETLELFRDDEVLVGGIYNVLLSECCSAPPAGISEYGICSHCHDHCEFYDSDKIEDEPEGRKLTDEEKFT